MLLLLLLLTQLKESNKGHLHLPASERKTIAKMSRAAAPRRVDVSFLSEEEAKQILQVLERDTQLKRAEKERIRLVYIYIGMA